MKRILVLAFTLFSVSLFAQNMPSGGVWGNTKFRAFTTNADTSAFLTLDQIKGYTNVGLAGGTVTSVSVVSANGFAGTVATATSTPAITLTTTATGVLKGNGTAISAATAGTDYSAGTSALATGILKSTTTTGALTIAVAADFPTLNQNTTGTASNVTGTVAIANGGTGQTTQAAALTALAGTQTANQILASNGTNTTLQAMTVAMLPTSIPNANLLNSSITLGAIGTTGTDLSWTSSPVSLGGTATLNVPDASATARGVITTGAQTVAGAKTLTGLTTLTGGSVNSANIVYSNTSLTSTTTLTTSSNSNISADATSAAFTITLPTTPTTGTQFVITKKNATTNYVTVTRGGANTIMGNTSHVIISKNIPTIFTFDGSDWTVSM